MFNRTKISKILHLYVIFGVILRLFNHEKSKHSDIYIENKLLWKK